MLSGTFARLFQSLLPAAVPAALLLLPHCGPDIYNAGDPSSAAYLETQLLRCALGDSAVCPSEVTVQEDSSLLIAPSNAHMCALNFQGRVRCWGSNAQGQLGYNNTTTVGDGVGPTIQQAGDVDMGGKAVQIVAGTSHNCALLDTGTVRCWGSNAQGQLGYNNTANVGDGTGPSIAAAGDVPVGGTVTRLTAGGTHTCAILEGGDVRCWGQGNNGGLGHGNTNNIGDGVGLSIIAAGNVPIGGTVTQIDAGSGFTCALLDSGALRCWGNGNVGRLGHNNTNHIADGIGLSIIAAGDVPAGGTIKKLQLGQNFTCVQYNDDNVRCWGNGNSGALGHDANTNIGDGGTSIIAAGNINLGGLAADLSTGSTFSCVKMQSGGIRCWGLGSLGRLGTGNTNVVGNGTGLSITAQGDMSLGHTPINVFAGYRSGCATISATEAKCWGRNINGELGINSTNAVGDDELPSAAAITTIF